MPGAAGGRPGASLPVRRFARRLCCEAGLPVGSGRGLCVGRGGSCAAVGRAGSFAAGVSAAVGLAGLARRWPALPGPGWPALGGAFAQRGGLALRRAFRGARGRGSVVHCLQWCASGVRRGGLCRRGLPCRGRGGLRWAGPLRSAVRGALSCMGRAAGVRPAGGKQQSYKYSKKSMSRKHQSQHPLTTTRNFSSSFPESLSG